MAWYDFPITQGYNPPQEYGVDVGTPYGTPITNVLPGRVTKADLSPGWGYEVDIQTTYNGQSVSEYFQHLDSLATGILPGASVASGQLLGTSGGQLSGGNAPNLPQYSSGPHTEFGFGAPWQGGGPNPDPTSLLQSLVSGGGTVTTNPGGTFTPVTPTTQAGQAAPTGSWCDWMHWIPNGDVLCLSLQSITTNLPGAILGGIGGLIAGFAPYIAGGILVIIGLKALLQEPAQVNISLAKGQK